MTDIVAPGTIIAPRKRFSARQVIPVASSYLAHLPSLLAAEPSRPVVLLCRVSTSTQDAAGNLHDGMMAAWRELKGLGVTPVAVFDAVESSSINTDRPVLESAIEEALRLGAILVVPSRDRLIRCRGYRGGKAVTELPDEHEVSELLRMAAGVPLATILPPDAKARPGQVRRGIKSKGAKVGRPRKPQPGAKRERRENLQPIAKALRLGGASLRAIAAELAVPVSTARRWL